MNAQLRPIEIAMAVTVPLVWGLGIVFAKGAMEHFPPILLMAFRFAVTALALVAFAKRPTGYYLALFKVSIVAAALQYSLTFTGLKSLNAGLAALVVQLEVPFLVLLGALLLHEQPSRRKWLGIAMAFVGVAIASAHSGFSGDALAILMVISGAFTWALGQTMVRRLNHLPGLTVTAWVAVFATGQLLMMSWLFESDQLAAVESADWKVWGTVIYMGLIMTALGYFLWNTLITRHPVGLVGPYLLLLPVFSVTGAVIFLGETLQWWELLGGAIILSGVAMINTDAPKPTARLTSPATPPTDEH